MGEYLSKYDTKPRSYKKKDLFFLHIKKYMEKYLYQIMNDKLTTKTKVNILL